MLVVKNVQSLTLGGKQRMVPFLLHRCQALQRPTLAQQPNQHPVLLQMYWMQKGIQYNPVMVVISSSQNHGHRCLEPFGAMMNVSKTPILVTMKASTHQEMKHTKMRTAIFGY